MGLSDAALLPQSFSDRPTSHWSVDRRLLVLLLTESLPQRYVSIKTWEFDGCLWVRLWFPAAISGLVRRRGIALSLWVSIWRYSHLVIRGFVCRALSISTSISTSISLSIVHLWPTLPVRHNTMSHLTNRFFCWWSCRCIQCEHVCCFIGQIHSQYS